MGAVEARMEWKSEIVPFGITVCGIEELPDHAGRGVSHVLSILDPGHPSPDAFNRYPAHAKLELRFHDIIKEREGEIVPREADVDLLLAFGRDLLDEPAAQRHLLVHCHMGISRSSAAMFLLLAQSRPDVDAKTLLGEVVRIRPRAWPNLLMIKFGDKLLDRQGALVAAAKAHYLERMMSNPQFGEFFRQVGREEEVDGE
jgi:predicted protein tyrosine phosphatase